MSGRSSAKIRSARRMHKLLRRMERREGLSLNLVSLIDVFTVLVFFLLVTSTSVQTMRNPRALTLPNSVAMETPQDAAVLMITPTDIQLQGRTIMSVEEAERQPGTILPQLKSELMLAALHQVQGAAAGSTTRGEVNIMADRAVPYSLLKKVMATCGEMKFARISLSVNHHGQVIAP